MSAANLVDASALPPRYALGERLGQGSSGETFAVLDTSEGAACVAKIFAADVAGRRVALNELARLQVIVDKTAGPQEFEAMASLVEHVRSVPVAQEHDAQT